MVDKDPSGANRVLQPGDPTLDRRVPQSGVHKFEVSDGNGGSYVGWTATIKRAHVTMAFVAALLTMAGTIFAAVQFGMRVEIDRALQQALDNPTSAINRQMDAKMDARCHDLERQLYQHLGSLATSLAALQQGQQAIRELLVRDARPTDRAPAGGAGNTGGAP